MREYFQDIFTPTTPPLKQIQNIVYLYFPKLSVH